MLVITRSPSCMHYLNIVKLMTSLHLHVADYLQTDYLTTEEQRKVAGNQISNIVEIVKANRDQPNVAKAIYERKQSFSGIHSFLFVCILFMVV